MQSLSPIGIAPRFSFRRKKWKTTDSIAVGCGPTGKWVPMIGSGVQDLFLRVTLSLGLLGVSGGERSIVLLTRVDCAVGDGVAGSLASGSGLDELGAFLYRREPPMLRRFIVLLRSLGDGVDGGEIS